AKEEDRITGFLHSPNSIGLAFSFGICVFWAAVVAVKRVAWRAIFLACLAVLYFGVIRTGSRGAFAAIASATIYLIWYFRTSIFRSPAIAISLAMAVVLGAAILPTWLPETVMGKRLKRALDTGSGDISKREGSTQLRVKLKGWALRESIKHPFFGLGRNNFWQVGRKTGEWNQTTHDNILGTLVETGFPGFIFYYSIYVWMWVKAGRFKKSPLLVGTEPAVLFLIRMMLIVLIVADVFDNTTWLNKSVWVLMALGIGFLQGLDR